MNEPTPEGMTEKHFRYLDQLRASGKTNMFGARPYLQRRFGLDRAQAKAFLIHWMKSKEAQ